MSIQSKTIKAIVATTLIFSFFGDLQADWLSKAKQELLKKATDAIEGVDKDKKEEDPDTQKESVEETAVAANKKDEGKEACCTGTVAAAATANTLDTVTDSQGGNLGQLRALAEGRRRMSDYIGSIVPPQVALASIYLHYYPESLEDDGNVEAYARHFFNEEFNQITRSEEYRTSVFKRRSIIDGWRTRFASMETSETLTLNIFIPSMLNTNVYDFEADSFPLSHPFKLSEESLISSGVFGLTCLKLDRTFSLKEYEVPESNVKAFMVENRNSPSAGRGASIFIGVQLKITGKPKSEGAARPRCSLAAEVNAIDVLEYNSSNDYSVSYARPGELMKSYYSRSAATSPSKNSAVQVTYDERKLESDAPAAARAFNLEALKGLIVMLPKGGRSARLSMRSKAWKALTDYGNFLSLGIYPEVYGNVKFARCMTRQYLSAADDAKYFPDRPTGQGWRGNTEFEKRRSEAAFKRDALPELQARAVQAPQRFLLLSEVHLPEYSFEQNGFLFRNLNATATLEIIYGDCTGGLRLLPMADQLHEFWSIAPAEAEAILKSMAVSHKVGDRSIRTAYHATVVELVNLKSARPKPVNPLMQVIQPPLRAKIISSHLYADEDLTRVIFSPSIIRAAPSVLEAGMPESVVYSKAYQIEYGSAGNLLYQLRARGGDLEEWEWPQLVKQQKYMDTRYYTLTQPNYRPQSMPPTALAEHDSQYTPFFPHGTEGEYLNYMTDEQMALFKEWSRRQMAVLP